MIFDDVTNYYFWSVFTAWILSIFIKLILHSIKEGKICIGSGFRNGGMPSSHSALMGSITIALLLNQGLSAVFFLALVISTLIIRDAVTVRREVGLIGEAINKLLKEKNMKELEVIYGHTVNQVTIGLIIGISSSLFFHFMF